jgi:hypothetical protein
MSVANAVDSFATDSFAPEVNLSEKQLHSILESMKQEPMYDAPSLLLAGSVIVGLVLLPFSSSFKL